MAHKTISALVLIPQLGEREKQPKPIHRRHGAKKQSNASYVYKINADRRKQK